VVDLSGVSIYAAEPTTPRLDAFQRANENPLANNTWLGPVFSGDVGVQIVGQAATGRVGGGSGSYWKNRLPTGNQEAWLTLKQQWVAQDNGFAIFLNMLNPGTSSLSGYVITIYESSSRDVDVLDGYRIDNGVLTLMTGALELGLNYVQDGDRFWVRNLEHLITVLRHDGNSWIQLATFADTAYDVGFIGLGIDNAEVVVDDYGGGVIGHNVVQAQGRRPYPYAPGTPNLPNLHRPSRF
jgi:hypothetical protein